jgi:hypothetical protein
VPSPLQQSFDFVLAADVLYTPEILWVSMLNTITSTLVAKGRFVLAQKHRESSEYTREGRIDKFLQMAAAEKLFAEKLFAGKETDERWARDVDIVSFKFNP